MPKKDAVDRVKAQKDLEAQRHGELVYGLALIVNGLGAEEDPINDIKGMRKDNLRETTRGNVEATKNVANMLGSLTGIIKADGDLAQMGGIKTRNLLCAISGLLRGISTALAFLCVCAGGGMAIGIMAFWG